MNKTQFVTAAFVPKPTLKKWANQVKPIKHERHPRKIRKRSIPNEPELSSHGSLPLFENINSSFGTKNTEISSIHHEQFKSTSDQPFESKNVEKSNDTFHQGTRRLEYSLIVMKIWLTVVSLTLLLVVIYLLVTSIRKSITTTASSTGNITTQTTTTTTTTGGDGAHVGTGGYTSIYFPTKDSFQVFLAPIISYIFTIVQNYSKTYRWSLNWVGVLE
ncbi:hypothetical protein I4U23_016976 [Adineta vaga]|nr:hypothetical protein I4U23_016976 [Adineta vaga]